MESETIHIDHAAYQAKTKTMIEDALRFTIRDAKDAMAANPEGHKAGYYQDEVHYCAMELMERSMLTAVQVCEGCPNSSTCCQAVGEKRCLLLAAQVQAI